MTLVADGHTGHEQAAAPAEEPAGPEPEVFEVTGSDTDEVVCVEVEHDERDAADQVTAQPTTSTPVLRRQWSCVSNLRT